MLFKLVRSAYSFRPSESFCTDGNVWKKLIFESRFYFNIGLLACSLFLTTMIEEADMRFLS